MDAAAGVRLPEAPGWVETSRCCVLAKLPSLVLASQKLTSFVLTALKLTLSGSLFCIQTATGNVLL
ncbi:hypothetical protein EIKCOROL_00387 [Eikenella corrodens ATCC 23834]|uniref:Uncharacterized protein n=1 Tax=Eikenella corrodens ATCC 23834 TaxID=546274 RepID=C0DSR5_EIKCO|nr:hypothetical protein EIKCOROL_00387 [Eikenella corrodens ATCC 23834]